MYLSSHHCFYKISNISTLSAASEMIIISNMDWLSDVIYPVAPARKRQKIYVKFPENSSNFQLLEHRLLMRSKMSECRITALCALQSRPKLVPCPYMHSTIDGPGSTDACWLQVGRNNACHETGTRSISCYNGPHAQSCSLSLNGTDCGTGATGHMAFIGTSYVINVARLAQISCYDAAGISFLYKFKKFLKRTFFNI